MRRSGRIASLLAWTVASVLSFTSGCGSDKPGAAGGTTGSGGSTGAGGVSATGGSGGASGGGGTTSTGTTGATSSEPW
jgi:hypothetical protein